MNTLVIALACFLAFYPGHAASHWGCNAKSFSNAVKKAEEAEVFFCLRIILFKILINLGC
jgi:hypothetical protein